MTLPTQLNATAAPGDVIQAYYVASGAFAGSSGTATEIVSPASLTITATANTKVYDGTTSALATPTVTGLQGSDTVTGLYEVYTDANPGTGKTLVVAGGYRINDGNSGKNYTVSTVTASGVIAPAAHHHPPWPRSNLTARPRRR
jgi:hypothetical protein